MILKNNLGMYAEEIINRTREYHISRGDNVYIEKREIPVKIIKKIDESTAVVKLTKKSYVDYFGLINNKHIEFEVKQTDEQSFCTSLLKDHQYEHLLKMKDLCITSFIIVFFSYYNTFILIDIRWLQKYLEDGNKKNIPFELLKKECIVVDIIFPGIIDINKGLNQLNFDIRKNC
ncbi:MAG: hypothetical protein Ta2E_08540 [Mycoplasmoidaceae bacterium]|nr:MAG: hypothetical protein Ta2E_08540 [Mycoplasmoidaceae bacterium]